MEGAVPTNNVSWTFPEGVVRDGGDNVITILQEYVCQLLISLKDEDDLF
jgi:hypothetical protein